MYSAQGRKIVTLIDGNRVPGTYTEWLNVNEISNGVYYLELKSNKNSVKKQITILKR
jgi:phosphoribulokinase